MSIGGPVSSRAIAWMRRVCAAVVQRRGGDCLHTSDSGFDRRGQGSHWRARGVAPGVPALYIHRRVCPRGDGWPRWLCPSPARLVRVCPLGMVSTCPDSIMGCGDVVRGVAFARFRSRFWGSFQAIGRWAVRPLSLRGQCTAERFPPLLLRAWDVHAAPDRVRALLMASALRARSVLEWLVAA